MYLMIWCSSLLCGFSTEPNRDDGLAVFGPASDWTMQMCTEWLTSVHLLCKFGIPLPTCWPDSGCLVLYILFN